jgi:hypothetical protein
MQTTAWRQHAPLVTTTRETLTETLTETACASCGQRMPPSAHGRAVIYQNGAIWSCEPRGNSLPCHSGK